MKPRYFVSAGLLWLALDLTARDITGHAVITRSLTRRTVSSVVYNLRGPNPVPARDNSQPVNEFERMVVILEPQKTDPKRTSKPPVTAVVDQHEIHFQPDLVVIPVGSTVEFPNSDPIFHNIFSLSKARSFDLGYYPRGQNRSVTFPTPGIVQVYCHIHANMYAAIVITASPWFGKPAADGTFSFSDVPPGRYRLTAWHKIAGLHAVNVEVPESGAVDLRIRVPVDAEQ